MSFPRLDEPNFAIALIEKFGRSICALRIDRRQTRHYEKNGFCTDRRPPAMRSSAES